MRNIILSLVFLLAFFSCSHPETEDYFVFLQTNPDKPMIPEDSVLKLHKAHLQNINRLYSLGKLTPAGPFVGGGGLFFLKAKSMLEARNLIYTDPAVRAKRFLIEIHPFIFEKGSICKLDSSYEMTTYQFLHFISPGKKKLSETENKMFLAGIGQLGSKVLMRGYFPDINSRIVIADTTGSENFGERLNELAISLKSLYQIENKGVWIVKGTFCENSTSDQ